MTKKTIELTQKVRPMEVRARGGGGGVGKEVCCETELSSVWEEQYLSSMGSESGKMVEVSDEGSIIMMNFNWVRLVCRWLDERFATGLIRAAVLRGCYW